MSAALHVAAVDNNDGIQETVAFVLAGGASHAAVQVGMLAALVEAGITADLVVGASAGALNGAAYAADPTPDGLARLADAWIAAKGSEVFPFRSVSVLLGALGLQDHLLRNTGLSRLVSQFIRAEQFAQTVIPVHVMATNAATGAPVVISEGAILPALLASCAIPALFPPVEIGGVQLIDGGIAADTPVLQAEALGATTIYVLPTFSAAAASRRRLSALQAGLQGIAHLLNQANAATTALAKHSVIHVLPTPATSDVNPLGLSNSKRLISEATQLTRSWLDREGMMGPSQPSLKLVHPLSA